MRRSEPPLPRESEEAFMYGALDIGGSKISVGLVEGSRVLDHCSLPTLAEEGPVAAVERCVGALRELQSRRGPVRMRAVGIACAGPVNSITGVIQNAYSLPGWECISFSGEMSARLNLPVHLDHDVGTTLRGQVELLRLRDRKVVLAMFGTGVGVSVFMNGRVFDNQSGFHPEFGSIRLRAEGVPCACGRKGCMDGLLSGTALHQRSRSAGFPGFAEMMRSADRKAETLRQRISEELEMFADTFGIIFQMDVLCFGGGIIRVAPDFFEQALSLPFRNSYHYAPACRVMPVQDTAAALIGAARLCQEAT